jgi:hypothetical protein
VRGFFGLPQNDQEEPQQPSAETTAGGDAEGDETQIIRAAGEEDTGAAGGAGEDDTQVLRQPGPLSDSDQYWNTRDDSGR